MAIAAAAGILAAILQQAWVEPGGSATGGGVSASMAEMSDYPAVAFDGTGAPIVAWTESVAGIGEICVRRWTGAAWAGLDGTDASVNISQTPAVVSGWSAIAVDTSNRAVVVWQEGSGNTAQVCLKRWENGSWQPIGTLAVGATAAMRPAVAIDAAGSPVVAWEFGPILKTVYLKVWNPATQAWEELAGSATGTYSTGGVSRTTTGTAIFPSVAIDPTTNRPVAAWQTPGAASSNVKRWTGAAWETLSGFSTSFATRPWLVVDSKGTPIVAASIEVGGNAEIIVRRWSGAAWVGMDGTETSANASNTTPGSSIPQLAIGPSDQPVVAWRDQIDTTYRIFVRAWSGSAWDAIGDSADPGLGATSGTSNWRNLALAVDPEGVPGVAWTSNSDPDACEIYYKQGLPPPKPPRLPVLEQLTRTGDVLPAGGTLNEFGVMLRSTLYDVNGDSIHLDVELRPATAAFQDEATAASARLANGSAASVIVDGLAPATTYHWQARAVDSTGRASAWVAGPGFSTRTNSGPTASLLVQRETESGRLLNVGAGVFNPSGLSITFEARLEDPDAGDRVRFEVELRKPGTPFTGETVFVSPETASGTTVSLALPLTGGHYRWRLRALDIVGASAGWISYGDNDESEADFSLVAFGSSGQGCLQSAEGTSDLGILLLVAAAVVLFRRRSAGLLFAVLALPAAAQSPPNDVLDFWTATADPADSHAITISWRETAGFHDEVLEYTPTSIYYDIRYATTSPGTALLDCRYDTPTWYAIATLVETEPGYRLDPPPYGAAMLEHSMKIGGLLPGTTYSFAWRLEFVADGDTYTTNYAYVVSARTSTDTAAPSAVADLAATSASGELVLEWTAPGDDGATGRATLYDLRWSTADPAGFATKEAWFAAASPVTNVPVPAVAGARQSATLANAPEGVTCYIALKTADEIPTLSGLSNVASGRREAVPAGPGDDDGGPKCGGSARGTAALVVALAIFLLRR